MAKEYESVIKSLREQLYTSKNKLAVAEETIRQLKSKETKTSKQKLLRMGEEIRVKDRIIEDFEGRISALQHIIKEVESKEEPLINEEDLENFKKRGDFYQTQYEEAIGKAEKLSDKLNIKQEIIENLKKENQRMEIEIERLENQCKRTEEDLKSSEDKHKSCSCLLYTSPSPRDS